MSDKELLELAAKAAGNGVYEMGGMYFEQLENGLVAKWSPLTDDGDALRLAVEIGLSIYMEPFRVGCPTQDDVVWEEVVLDGFAATRRAIVRTAAEIGKAMP
jgi:hypothetical protein